ncbi:MAG TPA: nuclear transport factor 2 family protein [Acidimicrobiia bacterium]|nr:nuclear transport factor 2 family protein [Acidimicrobiia bacterium]
MGENSERLAEAMGAISRGEIERFGDILLADDVLWHWPGQSAVSGDYHGRSAALALLEGFHTLTGNRLQVEPLDILEGERHLMSFTHVTADKEGDHLDVIMADAMRFGDDGRVVEFWTLSNDQEAVDAFIGRG